MTGDIESAKQQIETLTALQPNPKELAQIGFLDGQTKELIGDFEGAVVKWSEVEQGPHYLARIKSVWALVDLLSKRQLMSRPEAITELEKLRFAWRGDEFEFQLLRRLGELYIAEGAYREGLRTYRQAVTYYRAHRDVPAITDEMKLAFEKVYLGVDSGLLTPIEAIALYDEFKDLTPEGTRGDQLIEKLADRLVGIDLLDRATDLLQNQIDIRLTGPEKARVGARLALLHLLNHNAAKSAETLSATTAPNLTPELAIQRRLLQARAPAEVGKAPDAIALTLAGNERAVDRLRRDYEPTMTPTLYGDAFRLIADCPIEGLLDPKVLSGEVGEADKFRGFLAAYRERLRAQNLSAIN